MVLNNFRLSWYFYIENVVLRYVKILILELKIIFLIIYISNNVIVK